MTRGTAKTRRDEGAEGGGVRATSARLFIVGFFAALAAAASAAAQPQAEWTRQIGTSGFDAVRAIGADETGVYALGPVGGALPGQTYAGGANDVFLRKYDLAGNEVWTRQFGTPGLDFPSAGQVGIDEADVYITGFTDGTLPGETNAGGEDGFVRKYDAHGNVLWTDQFGTEGTTCNDEPNGLAVARGSVFVVWDNEFLPGCNDSFIRRYDSDGNVIWTRQFDVEGAGTVILFGVDADHTGIYVGGWISELPGLGGDSDAVVIKYDFDGNVVWTRHFGTEGREELEGVVVKQGSVYVAGVTFGTLGESSAGSADVFVRKYDIDGNEIWTRQFGSAGNESPSHVGVAADGRSVWVAGNVAGVLPGQTSAGGRDAFIRQYRDDGTVLWTLQFGTSGDDRAIPVTVGETDDVYLGGRTSGAFPGFTYAGNTDGFLMKVVKGE